VPDATLNWTNRCVAGAALAVLSCSAPRTGAPATPALPVAPAAQRHARPRLVVSVVFDQLPSWAFELHEKQLRRGGAFQRALDSGTIHRRSASAYASTYTAVGHASVYTGAPPNVSGIMVNEHWDAAADMRVPVVFDPASPVVGAADHFASPRRLEVDTVADVLKRTTNGEARVVSLSLKDRAAIIAGGKRPDLALWYDSRTGEFTTSKYYADAVPAFVAEFQRQHAPTRSLVPWLPLDAARLQAELGPDDAPGEGNWLGFGKTFPHNPQTAEAPFSVFRATPHSTEYLLALASTCVRELDLGSDDVPDLLLLSISSTDYAGHVFGAESWEYADNLVQSDLALGKFIDWLGSRTSVSVLITSDHGVAPLPERARANGKTALRVAPGELIPALEAQLAAELGPGPFLDALIPPFVYLSPSVPAERRADVARLAAKHLRRVPGVAYALTIDEAVAGSGHSDPVRRMIAASTRRDMQGDVYVVAQRDSVIEAEMPRGAGSHHGSPWPYDREVPVLLWGASVERRITSAAVPQERVAATLSVLLGVAPPARAATPPLPGVATR
jgi:predicted AlkP superfamily pyrophosphatase or phosphodiesterase